MGRAIDYALGMYILKRVLHAIPLIIGVIILTFLLVKLSPGDPVQIIAGEGATPEYYQFIRKEYGFDKPGYVQLLNYLSRILQGDLGNSLFFNQPVLKVIVDRIPATLLLMVAQFILSSILGVLLGVLSTWKPGSAADHGVIVLSLIWFSLPVFWSAQMLLLVFSIWLGIFPSQGIISVREELSGIAYISSVLHHLVLPAVSLALVYLALLARLTRTSMLEALRQDYIVTALAKGLDEKWVIFKHALRNAMLPITTIMGVNLGVMLTGAVLTETVFGWPGIGRLMYDSLSRRDYPVLMGIFMIASVSVILANLITDIVYAKLDPRIKT